MSLIWNNKISVSYFGEACDPVIGINITGLPKGENIDPEEIYSFIRRLSPKACRSGEDMRFPSPRILSGIRNNRTTGAPLCAIIQNPDIVTAEEKPSPEALVNRGNADYTGAARFKGYCDVKKQSGYSARFIAPLCFAGSVCAQILERRGIYTGAHIAQIHNVKDNPYDCVNISRDAILSIRSKDFPVIHDYKGWLMLEDIAKAAAAGESLGGIVECASANVPSGVGSPVFDGLENNIAQLVFGIPGVNGLEFGAGFSSARTVGSRVDDQFYFDERGYSVTKTNNHGGIIGGMSSGMPITLKVSVKPAVNGSACAVPSAVPCVEAAVNIALLSNMIDYPNFC